MIEILINNMQYILFAALIGFAIFMVKLFLNQQSKQIEQNYKTLSDADKLPCPAHYEILEKVTETNTVVKEMKTDVHELKEEIVEIKNKQTEHGERLFKLELQKKTTNIFSTKKECLLIEDNDMAMQMMATGLKKHLNMNVTKAVNFPQALEILDNQVFDCAVIDYWVHNLTADYFIEECKKRKKLIKKINGKVTLKALLYSGDGMAIKNSTFGVPSIEKPFKWKEFRNLMTYVLEE